MSDPRLNKIRYRAWHRGFREADLILGPFADAHLAELSDTELDAFEHLIDQPDHDLYGWIIGRDPAPAEMEGPVLDRLKAFHLTVGASGSGRGA
ncbi:FAD assembly factor SdhE [Phenylobacterium montanum]|uniref:FAD assembly factor SdhE n=1 Tax=Phenylobacterium montanum TaxID=2823693 RepID=A0A975IVM6_9CAUL|nr:succinate dehydrogenase assembly factor 2 [Caulobacter sp. S6]QUD88935.1 succinate dehydrogenase assembly factor 2 [Caulobacter sp. S6]